MAIGLIGEKCGMTRVFTEDGNCIPVTVLRVQSNKGTQIKTEDNDGYCAIQVTAGEKKPSRVNKAQAGIYSKAQVTPGKGLWEFRVAADELFLPAEEGQQEVTLGTEIPVTIFEPGQFVDVSSTSKGKGFAGAIKRHNFSMQDATHGNSLSHRSAGSIGQNQTPGRVFKGKKMAGQMGNKRCTVQSQEIISIDTSRNLVLVKGNVPGAPGADVIIAPAVKKSKAKE